MEQRPWGTAQCMRGNWYRYFEHTEFQIPIRHPKGGIEQARASQTWASIWVLGWSLRDGISQKVLSNGNPAGCGIHFDWCGCRRIRICGMQLNTKERRRRPKYQRWRVWDMCRVILKNQEVLPEVGMSNRVVNLAWGQILVNLAHNSPWKTWMD